MKHKKHNTPKTHKFDVVEYLTHGKVYFHPASLADLYPETPPFLKPVLDGCKELQDAKKNVTEESLALMSEIMLHRVTRLGRVERLQVPPDHGDTIREFMKAFRANVERSEQK